MPNNIAKKAKTIMQKSYYPGKSNHPAVHTVRNAAGYRIAEGSIDMHRCFYVR